jgi:hypothetical protein
VPPKEPTNISPTGKAVADDTPSLGARPSSSAESDAETNGKQALAEFRTRREQAKAVRKAKHEQTRAERRADAIEVLNKSDEPIRMPDGVSVWAEPHDPLPTKYDVPLARGGPIALLMVADLDTPEDVRSLQAMFSSDRGQRATVEQLRLAQEVGRLLCIAMHQGRRSQLWKRMPAGLHQMRGREMARRAVVEVLTELLRFRRDTDRLLKLYPNHVDLPREGVDFRVGKAIEELAAIDPRLARVTPSELKELLNHPRLEAVGIAVELSLRHAVFGDKLTPMESRAKAAARKRRIRGLYDEAIRQGR